MAKFLMLPLYIFGSLLVLSSAFETAQDLEASESVAKDHKVQSVASGSKDKYGYPYRIAPTLTPVIQSRSDEDENEAIRLAAAKPYGSRISGDEADSFALKKGQQKKSKVPNAYGATRRQDGEDVILEKILRNYKEPKYRNFDDLENDFKPRRRIDINYPYSQYDYSKPKPAVSPIDPYLTPSASPGDSFYPVPKMKSFPPPSYGHSSYDGPSYGAGKYDEPAPYHDEGYGGPPSSYPSSGGPTSSYPSSGGPSSSYTSSGGPPASYSSGGAQYGYHENYSIKSNEPIMGNIRKKLLDYAGASDLYEGEPDYLRQVARNKYKYGNLGNDYYSYGGPVHRDSYREFPYVESKVSLIKKSRG